MKIMVTGGTGFVGSHVVDALEKHFPPSTISLIVRDLAKADIRSETGLTIFLGDITVPESKNCSSNTLAKIIETIKKIVKS